MIVIVYCLKKSQSKAVSSLGEDNVMIEPVVEKNKIPEESGYEVNPISQEAMVEKFE